MKIIQIKSLTLIAITFLVSCNKSDSDFDASGSFEAVETIISSEANGKIEELNIEEGQTILAGTEIGVIDSTQLHLKRKQLLAQINAIDSKKPNISIQIAALKSQLKTAEKEQTRITNLVNGGAATNKQLDDINANIELIKKQIVALNSSLSISVNSIDKEVIPLNVQLEQINDQIGKCKIINPFTGTVLNKYAEKNEFTSTGKALYKMADLKTIILRVYITGDQLPNIKLNQSVRIFTDDGKGNYLESKGVISWISDKAEFTPKTIQTKDERANLVYATKIRVANDGRFKIGMYGEVKF